MTNPMGDNNPWDKFKIRNEEKHKPEDLSRLCTSVQTTSSQLIENFLTHDKHLLDVQVPRRRQILRDFLNEVVRPSPRAAEYCFDDINRHSKDDHVALVDDRQKHDGCMKSSGQICNECRIFSQAVSIPQLCHRLRENRRTHKAEKRILYIPNLTSAGALVLAATTASRSAVPIRNFLHRYLKREPIFSVSMAWGFFFEFHIPYHAMRRGPLLKTEDPRRISGERLRKSHPLPVLDEAGDQEELYYHEAQTSSLSWGTDEWFWTELFLVDTYFGSEDNRKTYLTNCAVGDGLDPPLGGRGSMAVPQFDPREYFLLIIDRRVEQVATEYSALVETFNKRMEEYTWRTLSRVFEDDNQRTNTRKLSHLIDTIHVFIDCISGIVNAWHTFSRTEISLFTRYAPKELTWPTILARISRNITELESLRTLLLTKRDRFKSKLDSLHTVSSLSQTEKANLQAITAVSQGDDLKVLTKMTVYVAFPLLFTTALFSMNFVTIQKTLWPVFFATVFPLALVNYMVASKKSPLSAWRDCKAWIQAAYHEVLQKTQTVSNAVLVAIFHLCRKII